MVETKPLAIPSFIRQGKGTRRRNGQLRVTEKYLSQNLLVLRGNSLSQLVSNQSYLSPSPACIIGYMPILELMASVYSTAESQLLFTETAVWQARDHSVTVGRGLKNLLFDTASCYSALNEQCAALFSTRQDSDESSDNYHLRLIASCCLYLRVSGHNNNSIGVQVLLADESDPLLVTCRQMGVPYVILKVVIAQWTGTNILSLNVISLCDELASKNNNLVSSTSEYEYAPHLSSYQVEVGLCNGSLLAGKLSTYSYSSFEGEVQLRSNVSIAFVSGRACMNRAMDGDEVVVKILPRSKWRRGLSLSDDNRLEEDPVLTSSETPLDGIPFVEVVAVKRRSIGQIVATLEQQTRLSTITDQDKDEHVIVTPLIRKLPRFRIRTRQKSILQSCRFVVAFDEWPIDSKYPRGRIVRIMGDSTDWRVEVDCILLDNGIAPKPFSLAALACLPAAPIPTPAINQSTSRRPAVSGLELPPHLLRGRRDMRASRSVFSVDPPGCQDIDDAMSVHWLGPGLIEVGVHIADVCGFVPADSALDIEAKERGTTVYLPHERHDMLPSLISSDLASLHGQVDRFTVSVTWDVAVTHKDGSLVEEAEDLMALDEKGDVYFSMPALPSWAGRGVIHSIAAATYAQAHNLIHGLPSDPKEELVPPGQAGRAIKKSKCARLRSDLRSLTAFARWLQRNRESLGALDLSQGSGAELKFKTDAEGNPVEVSGKEEMEVHHTISELMIAANSGVATIIYQAQPSQTLLRIHPPPSAEKLKMLQAEVLDAGIDLFQQKPSSDMQALLRTYREKVSRGHQPMAAELLTASVIRAMNEARYVGSGSLTGELAVAGPSSGSAADGRYLGHFGLGLRLYTHFTSPIRRYADVIVHRQLLSVLEAQSSAPKVGVVESVTVAEVADDLDFLDDLLDGVGDELFPQGIAIAGGGDNSNVKDIVKTPSEGKQKEPYSAAELEVVSTHLNTMNRRSKACQLGCQKLFLCMYFAGRTETHEGLISALKDNGFMVYLPVFNYRGPVYFNALDSSTAADYKCEPVYDDIALVRLNVVSLSTGQKVCLQPLQNVLIEVSASATLRELKLRFSALAPTHKALVVPSVSTGESFRSFIALMSREKEKVNVKRPDPTCGRHSLSGLAGTLLTRGSKRRRYADVWQCAVNSTQLYQDPSYRAPGVIQKSYESPSGSKIVKLQAQIKAFRHDVRGCGRIAFGPIEDFSLLYSAQSRSDELLSYEAKQQQTEAAVQVALGAGYLAAKAKMEKWGEEWAEEEDLPSSYEEASATPDTRVNLAGKYHKEVAISSQRLDKVKVAKRKSKYGS